ncbi:MAG TPA: 5-(carboxyamino)imidazole ribonucleotide synthase [Propioniciclava sp.]|uniref:5-(carboxyamino)imidazole ribonucleotide synthase n=1 Tax=Propioniciclava sp. TaxID=2038686 RepID=UPI002CB89555|nr:5-(carboxyamino)imidazole ribonucleotide synthase [Propioniciclava sp.]HRL49445.1 5-(carboxyamino)imidazole ribonucleotide synthase [Propioniciclava sp.]HRL79255.1 5-(carboxyamino)imidazole ribonucleotide synthase [Propioniciclava sp.]
MTDLTIGIVGGGQLARMMNEAATPLGLRVRLLAEAPQTAAAQVVPDTTVGDYADAATLSDFAADVTAVTFDHEHVPTGLLAELEASGTPVRPGPTALEFAQDKAAMRARLSALGVPCPAWRVVATPQELADFAAETGWPVIAKTSRGGYDGKGVWKLAGPQEAEAPFAALQHALGPTERDTAADAPADAVIVAEEFIPFTRELSVLVARRPGGEAVAYPVTETVQRDGICHETTTPAPGLDAARAAALEALGRRIADELGVVGILAVELMERPDGEIVVNELAMRPHNTGHWSIEGAVTSQFENHLRAVADLPLGSAALRAPVAVMTNVLGGANPDLVGSLNRVLSDPDVRVHLYGKGVKPGRKVGHITVLGADVDAARRSARAAAAILEGE